MCACVAKLRRHSRPRAGQCGAGCAREREGKKGGKAGPPAGRPWEGEEEEASQRKRGPSGQNEGGGLSSFYFVFFYFKALFKLISKAFEFVLNFDQNHTSQ